MGVRRSAFVAGIVAVVAVVTACVPPPTSSARQDPLTLGRNNQLGNANAHSAAISADGRWVAFVSSADNLVPGDDNDEDDLFLRDRRSGSVTRVREGASNPTISTNGRYVSYRASGLTMGVYDRSSRTRTEWTSVLSNGRTPVVAPDGSAAIYGAYSSFGIFATGCRVRDLVADTEADCPAGGPGFGTTAFEAVSPNARYVLYFWNDQSGGNTSARLLWDRQLGTTTVVDQLILALGSTTSISDDGRYVSAIDIVEGTGLVPVVHDLVTGTTTVFPVDPGPETTTVAVDLSGDGTTALVFSDSAELVDGDTNEALDAFLWDHAAGTIERISLTRAGQELEPGALNCGPSPGQLLADGSAGCILTPAAVVPSDTNGVVDAYLVG